MKKIIICLFTVNVYCISSCKNILVKEFFITVRNESPYSIVYMFSEIYPDTSIPFNLAGGLLAHQEGTKSYRGKLSPFFNRLPKDTLSVFFFSQDTIAKYGWDEVRRGYRILKRYDLSEEDLERSNVVVYP